MYIEKNISFNDIGQEIDIKIQLKYKDLKVFEFPANCSKCPCGFSNNANCGRNVPFKNEDYKTRPKTCKLKKINYIEFLDDDFEKVKHGKWIPIDIEQEFFSCIDETTIYKCSLCGRYEDKQEPYCNCGAKMDLKEE